MEPDSPLERVRKARCQISEECGNDPQRLVEYYMKLQERHHERLVSSTNQSLAAASGEESDGGKRVIPARKPE
jgi:hypothetical protein